MNNLIKVIKNESKKAILKNEIPVGSLLYDPNNKIIISKSYNKTISKKTIFGHSEIQTIIKAEKKLKTNNLKEYELYVTLEPCLFCYGAILNSKIKKIFYIVDADVSYKEFFKNKIKICKVLDINNEEKNKLKKFFNKLR